MAVSYGSYMVAADAGRDRPRGREPDERRGGVGASGPRLGLDPATSSSRRGPVCWLASRPRAGGRAPACCRQAGATVQFVDTFPSFADGSARLHSPASELPLPRYRPLESRLSAHPRQPGDGQDDQHHVRRVRSPPAVAVAPPDDAAPRGLVDGEVVRVLNDQGAIELPCASTTRCGLACVPSRKGCGCAACRPGQSANVFVPATTSDLAGGACFNDARVDVAPSCESETPR